MLMDTDDISNQDSVFMVGAGFSKAISEEMPTLPDLTTAVLSQLEGPFPWQNELGSDIEALLSYLANKQPWKSPDQVLEDSAWAFRIRNQIHRSVSHAQGREMANDDKVPPGWLLDLVGYWHESRATTLCFNYDTLIEAAFLSYLRRSAPDEKRDTSFLSLYSVPIPRAGSRINTYFSPVLEPSFRLLKLHGSINWYYSGEYAGSADPVYATDVPQAWGSDAWMPALTTQEWVRDKEPLIVPPQAEKGRLFTHATIRAQWREAYMSLERASDLYVMGYSLPRTDLTVRLMLKAAAPLRIHLIDQRAEAIEHYRTLGPEIDCVEESSGHGAVETFVGSLKRA